MLPETNQWILLLLWNTYPISAVDQRWQLSRLLVPFKALGHCRHLSPALREDEPSMASIGLPFGPSVITHMAIENILFIDDFPIEISIQFGDFQLPAMCDSRNVNWLILDRWKPRINRINFEPPQPPLRGAVPRVPARIAVICATWPWLQLS